MLWCKSLIGGLVHWITVQEPDGFYTESGSSFPIIVEQHMDEQTSETVEDWEKVFEWKMI